MITNRLFLASLGVLAPRDFGVNTICSREPAVLNASVKNRAWRSHIPAPVTLSDFIHYSIF